ncbi:hypothetical protein ES288_A05G321800v1 [Gossypium darwinii]|uniref:Uncharacterized protein n=1 Tax=Gossypium darwinii TaxID=34276 RepID=A0A5D2GMI7_GOSDA|nr:hypothetical protein ES288_A05G321800v1 [Gossypium darwinii]
MAMCHFVPAAKQITPPFYPFRLGFDLNLGAPPYHHRTWWPTTRRRDTMRSRRYGVVEKCYLHYQCN